MLPLVLAMRVCLIADPAQCHDLPPLPLSGGTTMIGCALAVQIEGVKWQMAHPNWFVARSRCGPVSRPADL